MLDHKQNAKSCPQQPEQRYRRVAAGPRKPSRKHRALNQSLISLMESAEGRHLFARLLSGCMAMALDGHPQPLGRAAACLVEDFGGGLEVVVDEKVEPYVSIARHEGCREEAPDCVIVVESPRLPSASGD